MTTRDLDAGGETVHATALAFGEHGLLVRGASGSGKSLLALALLARADAFARLVADDRVLLSAAGGRLVARAPAALAGLVELRGVGILSLPALPAVRLTLVVDLVAPPEVPRLPEPAETAMVRGIALPRLRLPAGATEVATVSLLTHLRQAGLTDCRRGSQRAPATARSSDDGAPPGAGQDGRSM